MKCSAVAAAVALRKIAGMANPSAPGNTSIDQLGLSDFTALLNRPFQVHPDAQRRVSLELIKAIATPVSTRGAANAPDAHHEKFSLLFRGPQTPALPQDTYCFEQSDLGRFPVFITKIGHTDADHCYYEAIFSRPPA